MHENARFSSQNAAKSNMYQSYMYITYTYTRHMTHEKEILQFPKYRNISDVITDWDERKVDASSRYFSLRLENLETSKLIHQMRGVKAEDSSFRFDKIHDQDG